jgi:hypothetical protein
MNDRIQILVRRRFWVGFAIALLSGLYVGMTFHYPGLFVRDWDLMPLLIIPSVIAGVFSGWRSILNCLLLLFVAAALLFARALWGRHLTTDYIQFAFQLTFGSVVDALPRALLYSFLASLPVSLAVSFFRSAQPSDEPNGVPRWRAALRRLS